MTAKRSKTQYFHLETVQKKESEDRRDGIWREPWGSAIRILHS